MERTSKKKGELIHNRVNKGKNVNLKLQNTSGKDFSADYTSKPELKGEESEHEVTDTNSESRKVFFSDGESLTGDSPDSSILSDHNSPKKKISKSPFADFSKGEKALLLFVALSSAAFIASFISSVLGKPLCPDEKGNLISLAILGTVAIISVAVSLVHFHYPDKSKENDPLSEFDSNGVEMLMPESKKNR